MSNLNKTVLFPSLLIAAVVAATSAQAWQRNSSTTGPHGRTNTSSGSGHCSGGACSSNQAVTGPRGYTATRSGSTTCSGGTCNGSATYTGPQGNTVTRTRSFSR